MSAHVAPQPWKSPAAWTAGRLDRLSDRAFATVAFLPGFLLVAFFLGLPILLAFGMSLLRISLARGADMPFTGLRNYALLAGDSQLLQSLPLTIGFAAFTTLITIPISLAAALLLNRRFRLSGLLGVGLLLPWAVAPIVTGLYWQFMFQGQFGIATAIVNAIGLHNGPVAWLQMPLAAVLIAAIATTWRSAPLYTVILLAALKAIPRSQYAAAKVDGATEFELFRFVTLPSLRNALLVVTILQLIVVLQTFDLLFTLTQGGPGTATTVVIYYIFKTAFEELNLGYSAAIAVFLTLIIALCTGLLILARVRGRRTRTYTTDDFPVQQDVSRIVSGPFPPVKRRGVRLPRWIGPLATALGGGLLVLWSIGPIVWMILASLQPEGAVTSVPLQLTVDLRWANYTNLFFNPGQFTTLPWLSSTWVSIQVAVLATVITIVVSALIAYPLARLEVPGRGLFMGSLIATQMVPAIVLAIPVLLVFRALHLVDTIPGLVLVNVAFSIPVIAWLLRNSFEDVPRSIESAARIDGCSRLGTLFRITMPAARPGIAAAAILMLIGTWNEFLFAVVLGNHDAVTVTRLIGLVNTTTGPMGRPPYTLVAAAGVVAIAPCVALVALFYRQIVQGLTEGYVKG